jgi:peptide/nickel transport system permease protein
MTNYLIRRFFQMILVVFLSTVVIYAILGLVPGGPLDQLRMIADERQRVTEDDIARLERMLGLDKPVALQYVTWLVGDDWMSGPLAQYRGERRGLLRGDWGTSWRVAFGRPVTELILARLPNTITLMLTSVLVSLIVAIPIGILSAVRQYSRFDYVATTAAFIGVALPVFWFGLMMILVFSLLFRQWGIPNLPPGGMQSLRAPSPQSLIGVLGFSPGSLGDRLIHLLMPTFVLSMLYMAGWTRYMRSSMLEVLRQDYVRTARAKGLVERLVIAKHALRNALIPIITIVVFQIPGIFGGAIITETIFAWNGMGRLYIDALNQTDWPVVMVFLFLVAILVVIANLIADVLYTVVDPRIRYS